MKKWLYNLIFYCKLATQHDFLQLIGREHPPPYGPLSGTPSTWAYNGLVESKDNYLFLYYMRVA
jgi:hypothetical protein